MLVVDTFTMGEKDGCVMGIFGIIFHNPGFLFLFGLELRERLFCYSLL